MLIKEGHLFDILASGVVHILGSARIRARVLIGGNTVNCRAPLGKT